MALDSMGRNLQNLTNENNFLKQQN